MVQIGRANQATNCSRNRLKFGLDFLSWKGQDTFTTPIFKSRPETLMLTITNIAAYKFADLRDLKPLRDQLITRCKQWRLKGTILLSREGINLFVAGKRASIDALLGELRGVPGLESLEPKFSESSEQPFRRMLVKIKREIIAFGVEGIDPAHHPAPKLSPRELKQWLDEGRPVTLLDTRNDYEVRLGTFSDALCLQIDHFREFPAAVRKLPETLKHHPIVMFCTGGIRCEKAGPFMQREGFEKIFQLDGGILKYFEECGGSHYSGECFVFDQRVGVDPSLHESETAQCFVCQSPLSPEDCDDERFLEGQSCPYCFRSTEDKKTQRLTERNAAIGPLISPLPGSRPYEIHRPLNVSAQFDGQKLLSFLRGILHQIPEQDWKNACEQGRLRRRLSGTTTTSSDGETLRAMCIDEIVRAGDRLIHVQPCASEPEVCADFRILHEDEALIVVQKPAPLPMHPCGRFNRNTLQYLLCQLYQPQSPRPVHRLDANTTGIVLFARTRHFANCLQQQFDHQRSGGIEKRYLARVHGIPSSDHFSCRLPISDEAHELGSRQVDLLNGQTAHTDFCVLQRFADGTTLLEAIPRTGRTNQIRVHLWHLDLPICGDPTYLPNRELGETQTLAVDSVPLCLFAHRITLRHPLSKQATTFEAPTGLVQN